MIQGTSLTKSSKETQELAQKLAKELKGNEVIALFGNLGSGKTTFVQGLAKGLGVRERIISPTFIIIREHKINQKSNLKNKKLYHVDLYRVQPEQFRGLELGEILKRKGAIVAIEWAEKIKNLLPEKRVEIYFENLGEYKRRIRIVSMTYLPAGRFKS